MGLGKIGHPLSRSRDGSFRQGHDANITLEPKRTIKEAASCRAFRYRCEAQPG